MRIAVHPELQSNGLGSYLIKQVIKRAQKKRVDFIGASYAAEPEVVNFWLGNGFTLIRVGGARGSSSGTFSCEVLACVKATHKATLQNLNARFSQSFQYKLRRELRTLDSRVVLFWLLRQRETSLDGLSYSDSQELLLFSQGARSLASVDWLLAEQILHSLSQSLDTIELLDSLFLIDLCIKQLPISEIAPLYGLTGKKQVTALARNSISRLISSREFCALNK